MSCWVSSHTINVRTITYLLHGSRSEELASHGLELQFRKSQDFRQVRFKNLIDYQGFIWGDIGF